MTSIIISADDRAQLAEAFVAEAEEVLARFEESLLQLEQSPDEEGLLHEIFRAAHTLKGSAGCLQFDALTALAHAAEELLERLRLGEIQVTPACISLLLDAVDAFRDLTARSVAGDGTLTPAQQSLLEDLAAFVSAGTAPVAPSSNGTAPAPSAPAQRTLRVSASKLDRMLDLSGEIAIARGHIRQQLLHGGNDREQVLDALSELDRLNIELQEQVVHARLVPLGPALRHFHRIVRDLAATQGKRVSLVIEGGDVEVDTAVIENLKDPLTHMVRNAIDHGIETPDVRVARHKSAAATISITAAQENGGIVIRFSDDGQGIDEAQIAHRAKSKGIDIDRFTRTEILSLIFEPGLTTAKAVSNLSGRGVGMDIVRRNVELLRGTVSVDSERGQRTTIIIRLPLTVAVIEGFAVGVGDETYVIPIESVVECVDMDVELSSSARGVINLRGEPLPFLNLRALFNLDDAPSSRRNVVVVQHDQGRAGLVVDELLGGHQTVMKPLQGVLRHLPGISGSSILGSGRVALVLDTYEVVRQASHSFNSTNNN